MITLLEAKSSTLKNISSVTVNSAEFKDLLNEATRLLLRRGDWFGTIRPMYVCSYRGCITMPRYVGSVRKLKTCGTRMQAGNQWFEFLDPRSSSATNTLFAHGQNFNMVYSEEVSCFNDINPLAPQYLRLFIEYPQDAGKVVTIFGEDENGQPLVTPNGDGTVKQGYEMTLANPHVQSPIKVRSIERVVKQATGGRVRLYSVDPDAAILQDLAIWGGAELSPSYKRYNLNLGCSDTTHSLLLLVKLAFVPVSADSDLVLIENLDALKAMMQSVKMREGGNRKEAQAFEMDAIRELNLELTDNFPDDQTPVDDGVFGGTDVGFQQCY